MSGLLLLAALLSSVAPLPAELQRAIAALPADPPPPKLNNDTHYVVSNERRPDLFYRAAKGRGGVYVGIGAEQNYILAGWARPDLMILLDFDQVIVDLHAVYRAFILEAESPEALRALWQPASRGQALRILEQRVPKAMRDAARAAYEQAQPAVHKRLAEHARKAREHRRPNALTGSLEDYGHVRKLVQTGRVVAVRGDLTGSRTLQAVASVLTSGGLIVRTLYLSNAEQYFMYGPGYRANMLALPTDARSVVLRTLPGRPRGYEYIRQSAANFNAWLRHKRTNSVYIMRGFKRGQKLAGETQHHITRKPPQ